MGPIMAIGGVDMLIPPSALAVLLGSLAGISISHSSSRASCRASLLAGHVRRVHRARALRARTWRRHTSRRSARLGPLAALAVYVTPLLGIFVVVIVAMVAGWATPTESAAIGAVATVAVAAMYRSLTVRSLMQALLGTAGDFRNDPVHHRRRDHLFADPHILGGHARHGGSGAKRRGQPARGCSIGMLGVLLLLGCFIDQVSMMLITLPFFMPLVALTASIRSGSVSCPHLHAARPAHARRSACSCSP